MTSSHVTSFPIFFDGLHYSHSSYWIPKTLQINIHKMSNNTGSVEDELDKMWKTQVDNVQSGPSSWRHDGC